MRHFRGLGNVLYPCDFSKIFVISTVSQDPVPLASVPLAFSLSCCLRASIPLDPQTL